ncbi:MAG: glycosyl hydrolase [Rhodoferax sp.]|nr:glycosyl hydrolase [Rhodoferax sp.]
MKVLNKWGMGLLLGLSMALVTSAQPVKLGASTYHLAPKTGDKPPPQALHRTEAMQKLAAPTNQWYSTLIFNPKPEALFAHPLTVKTTPAGLELALPSKQVVPTEFRETEIHYMHRDALVIAPMAFEPGPAKLARASDWAVDIAMDRGADQMQVTVAHGSPYAHITLSRGDVRIKLPSVGERIGIGADARVLALRVGAKPYAMFGPTGVRWEQVSPTEWLGRLPAGAGYLSAAALPDERPESLQLLTRHAYAFLQDTRVDWRFDAATSKVETTFTAKTRVMEGADNGPLLGLYPHQWFKNAALEGKLGPSYDSIRGKIHLLAASQFKIERTYHGVLPHWPGIKEGKGANELNDLLKVDMRKRRELIPGRENKDNWRVSAYWQGKGLTRATQLAAVAEQQGDPGARDQLLALVKDRMEWWFGGAGRSYFHVDKGLGTVVTYPDEFFAVAEMNDHHFHYGYWIRAAAEIALRDPAWAAKDQWGGMVDLLVADIATPQRGRSDFPFLRPFDPYSGFSMASGVGLYDFGNGQESTSEAINAWASLILWGEATGNRELRDLGIYLYTTEIDAVSHYWFDIHGQVFPPEYKNVEVSWVFGGRYAHKTWWTDEPRQTKGINLLPVTTFSTYLGRDPAYVKRNVAALKPETDNYNAIGKFPPNPPPKDVWQDIFAKYLALADPAAALAQWDRYGSVEAGDTRTHTLHWMLSLQEMGTPDFSVTANTTLYSVFKRADGRKTYLAYNAGKSPIEVTFSDGKTLTVAAGALGRL